MPFSPASCYFLPLSSKNSPKLHVFRHNLSSLRVRHKFHTHIEQVKLWFTLLYRILKDKVSNSTVEAFPEFNLLLIYS
jgi:hypothetical protein